MRPFERVSMDVKTRCLCTRAISTTFRRQEKLMHTYRQIVMASRPKGTPTAENFRLETGSIPIAPDGQVLVRTQYLSLHPYMRGGMHNAKSDAATGIGGCVNEGEGGA